MYEITPVGFISRGEYYASETGVRLHPDEAPRYDQSAIDTLQARIAELEARLEIDPRAPKYDAVFCRDESIRLLEQECSEAHQRNYDQSTEIFNLKEDLSKMACYGDQKIRIDKLEAALRETLELCEDYGVDSPYCAVDKAREALGIKP